MGVHQENLLANKFRVKHGNTEVKPAAKFAEADKIFRVRPSEQPVVSNGPVMTEHEPAKVEAPTTQMDTEPTTVPPTPQIEERSADFYEAILELSAAMKTKMADQTASLELLLEEQSRQAAMLKLIEDKLSSSPAHVAAVTVEEKLADDDGMLGKTEPATVVAPNTRSSSPVPVERSYDVTVTPWAEGIQVRLNRDLWDKAGFPENSDRVVIDIEDEMLILRFPDKGEKSRGIWMKNGVSVYVRSSLFLVTERYHPDVLEVHHGEIVLSLTDSEAE